MGSAHVLKPEFGPYSGNWVWVVESLPSIYLHYSLFTVSVTLSLFERIQMTVAAAPVPSRREALSLFRSLLRIAREFPDYNIRDYTKRRTIDAFRQNRSLSDPSSVSSAFSDGKSQLEVANRQALVYSLYAPKLKSVMELHHP
ncbi:uncharacterized protein LOC107415951 [Ziziphus jujuba]|uniref:Uncharacterized protein LOC107415951 n=1 Tax=Ziziphus jujuba TaxID=326968 RepID=A0A6P3ZLI1_ZIZJJ|nr:uncharacterized protein LOC107415951 [Ziziphus jujuba]